MIMRTNVVTFFMLWILAIGLVFVAYHSMNNEYMTERPFNVTVVDKMTVEGSKGSVNLAVIYKTDDGIVFDDYVSPSTYATSYVGDRYAIKFRPFDVRQTAKQNALFFILPVFVASISFTFVVAMLIFGWSLLSTTKEPVAASHLKPQLRRFVE